MEGSNDEDDDDDFDDDSEGYFLSFFYFNTWKYIYAIYFDYNVRLVADDEDMLDHYLAEKFDSSNN